MVSKFVFAHFFFAPRPNPACTSDFLPFGLSARQFAVYAEVMQAMVYLAMVYLAMVHLVEAAACLLSAKKKTPVVLAISVSHRPLREVPQDV